MTHDQIAKLSAYLSHEVTSTVPLEIRPSSIAGAKHGLFTTAAIREGEEIFRSDPLITCVDDGMQAIVCDYCFLYSRSAILPSGQFRQTSEGTQPFKTCSRCKVCYYCSKVGSLSLILNRRQLHFWRLISFRKNCQLNAWRRYHQHECPILSEKNDMHARTRALYRLIIMQKAGLIDAEQWDAVKHLETYHAKHLRGPISTAIVNTSISAGMKTNMRVSEVQKIYCAVCYRS